MPDDTGKLKRLGEEIAGALGDGPSESRLMAQKHDVVSVFRAEPKPRRARYVAMALAASITILVVGFVATQMSDSRLRFWVGDRLDVGSEGVWMTSTSEQKLPVRFEGGSRVELQIDTVARVSKSNEDNVEVELKKGEVFAQVAGNGKTKWTVEAGPYQVTVMGTEFFVSWDDEDSLLNVLVQRGAVNVSGAGLSNEGVSLAAGDNLEVNDGEVLATMGSSRAAEVDVADIPMPEQAEPVNEEVVIGLDQLDLEPEEERENPKTLPRVAPQENAEKVAKVETWKDFYKLKDFVKATEIAEKRGIDGLSESLDQEDLWQLANAARYANKGGSSTKLLLAFRERFSASRKAEVATFLLGRVALELSGNSNKASMWFETYLSENPNGSLAEEALGRFVDASEKAGRHEKAKKSAQSYLARYPKGPFAELAQSVLSK